MKTDVSIIIYKDIEIKIITENNHQLALFPDKIDQNSDYTHSTACF